MSRSTNRLALIAALLLTVGIGTSFANAIPTDTDNGSKMVIASFHKDFRTAEVMGVEVKKDFTKVTFKLNNLVLFAYYSENGDLMAVVRNILSTQLPIRLLMDLKQNHADCWITELFEIDSNDQTTYYAALENGDTRVTLRSNSYNWETYHK